jgi:light-regulated signal transduction histidine kinase (bacteriophytochrome)
LSRVTRSDMSKESVDLSHLARRVCQDLQQSHPDRTVEIEIQSGLIAHGDVRLLQVVLDNLLNNAWKFTAKQAKAKIEFGAIEQEDGITAYFVRDDGAGFDLAFIDKLFSPFQRLHGMREFPGNGIGLATVQRIVHRHGGKTWAIGALEQGATFYFTLAEGEIEE